MKKRVQPAVGTYRDWKETVRGYCWEQCAYCGIPDGRFGGPRNFHVEHYKPKGNPRFKMLSDDIHNLLYACGICNVFKGGDWPNDPSDDHSIPSYPDPTKHDYNELFEIDPGTRRVQGLRVASKYVTERLYLNRPQLITERRLFALRDEIESLRTLATRMRTDLVTQGNDPEMITLWYRLAGLLFEILEWWSRVPYSAPYDVADVTRPRRSTAKGGKAAKATKATKATKAG